MLSRSTTREALSAYLLPLTTNLSIQRELIELQAHALDNTLKAGMLAQRQQAEQIAAPRTQLTAMETKMKKELDALKALAVNRRTTGRRLNPRLSKGD
jgi:hypothetical protein